MNPIQALEQLGQSVWLDTIDRELLTSGGLRRLIADEGVRGVTTNPTIFEQAIAHGTAYDGAIAALAAVRQDSAALFESLAVADVAEAADQLRPVYDAAGGNDGFVSIEVAPTRAFDTAATIAEGRRLWTRVDRPNVMVKVPGTVEGLPAIEQLIADGVNVNITLLFSVDMYRRVIDAYFTGLERRVQAGERLARLRSVASFFVSRVDGEADKRLAALAAAAKDPAERRRIEGLLGRAAVANAKLAYEAFQASIASPRFQALRARGAAVQRPLWASTSTKNPDYPDTLYVDDLIGPDTVNTMPLVTLRAFADHGRAERTVDRGLDEARAALGAIEASGVKLKDVTDLLVVDGVKKFADSYHALLGSLEAKRDALLASRPVRASRRLAAFDDDVAGLVKRDAAERTRRLVARDPGLWSDEPAARREIAERLGWLDLPRAMADCVSDLAEFTAGVRRDGFTRVVLLGMGGSSLAPETFGRVFGAAAGHPSLAVLDSTDPAYIARIERAAPLERTFFLVSSKSGTTLETSDLFAWFWERTGARGAQFAAITDPGTPLAALGRERKLRRVFEARSDVGGRYSALSHFGLVPASLLGVDLATLLARAARMADACLGTSGADPGPGARLGAALAAAWEDGRDKVTIATGAGLEAFGPWVEQLLAESTGKHGKGLVPVVGEPLAPPSAYGPDRLFVALQLAGAPEPRLAQSLADLEGAGHPVVRLSLADRLDLGAEFYRWEVATALAGSWMGINAFDQPNVAESKDNTGRVLQQLVAGATPSAPPPAEDAHLGDALARWLAGIGGSDYAALLAYLPPSAEHDADLTAMRVAIRDALGVATTAAYGPRYLHSTGQLHKGGPSSGAFLAVESGDGPELRVPGRNYAFATLELAQALGDLVALERRGRPVVRIRVGPGGLGAVRAAVERAARAGR
ncbi:MAG TPA: bifunctional transaldolase/phosoglucose isomerase [Gemmatimonadales bacterium]|nr:bifunctional transaldolase/phosoglucose isomerase [Gemmatimonadales bacterium]